MELQGNFRGQDPKKSRNLIAVLCCFADSRVLAFCAISALIRELTEEEAIAHACVSKSCYHEFKKHLLEIIVLPPRTAIGKKSKKRCWSLRENDRYDNICGVSGNVYFPLTNEEAKKEEERMSRSV